MQPKNERAETATGERLAAVALRYESGEPAPRVVAKGQGLIAEQIIKLDPINPQVASRLARSFDRWKRFDGGRQQHSRAALESVRSQSGLSRDVFEVVDKALG